MELNTIAASFACLSTITTQLHHYTLGRLAAAAAANSSSSSSSAVPPELLSGERLHSNTAMQGICRALAAAVKAGGGEGAVMVMVVQPGERNAYDQQVGGLAFTALTVWLCRGYKGFGVRVRVFVVQRRLACRVWLHRVVFS